MFRIKGFISQNASIYFVEARKGKIREDNLVTPTKVNRKRNSLVNRIGEINMPRIKPHSYKSK